jgi:predicted transcriptional regulator
MKRNNPETSLEAHKSLDPVKLRDIYEKILWGMGQIGECTFEELSVAIKIPKEKIWKRLSEMARLNLIYRPGNKRTLASGCLGYTWKLVEKDKEPTIEIEKMQDGLTIQDHSRNIQEIKKQVKQLNLL